MRALGRQAFGAVDQLTEFLLGQADLELAVAQIATRAGKVEPEVCLVPEARR